MAGYEFNNLKLRQMTYDDLERVSEMERIAFPDPWPKEIFRECLTMARCRILEKNGELVAYAVYSIEHQVGHLMNLCVDPSMRRKGFGRFLLTQILMELNSDAARLVYLEVRASNLAAVRLYERFGFRNIGRRRGYYQSDMGAEDALVYLLVASEAETRD